MVATATADLENILQEAREIFDLRYVRPLKRIDCILTVLSKSEKEKGKKRSCLPQAKHRVFQGKDEKNEKRQQLSSSSVRESSIERNGW